MTENDGTQGPQRPLPVAHGPGQHAGHAQVALDPGGEAPIGTCHPDLVDEIGEHCQLDAGLAE